MKKIAFFDIDGTITSELDGTIPQSAVCAIQKARANGHLMFINTGRCFHNIESRFRDIGFDGYVCGCGTNVFCSGTEIFHAAQTHELTMRLLHKAQELNIDIFFESRNLVTTDQTRPLIHPDAVRLYNGIVKLGYEMPYDLENPNFFCDKFVIWYQTPEQLASFRSVSDPYFDCIDRGGTFREFAPIGHSKATGIRRVLDYYDLDNRTTYGFGDSNNDLPMLSYVAHSVAMGNAVPKSLFEQVSYVTDPASANGLAKALEHLGFLDETPNF